MRKELLATICMGAGVMAASPPVCAEGSGYIGLAVGEMRADACSGAPSGVRCEDSDTSVRFFGGYQLTPYLAGEIGGSLLGSISAATGESADLSAIDFSAIGSWPVGNRFTLLGRFGAYSGRTATKGGAALPLPPGAAQPTVGWKGGSSDGLTYGLGASYAFTHTGSFRLEWQHFNNMGGNGGLKFDVDIFSIAALSRF